MSIVKKILIVLCILLALVVGIAYDTFYNAPQRFTVRYETLKSELIPQQMDEVNILYFSDLHYGTFMNNKRLELLVKRINELGPDIVLFGGDLIDRKLNREERLKLTEYLSQINAPLGKFAVYGDFDNMSTSDHNNVTEVLENSGFEIVNNRSIVLRNKRSKGITLVGLDTSDKGYADINAAYQNVNPAGYTITLCHTPDTALLVPTQKTNYYLCGHSHGGQLFYIFDSYYRPEYTDYFFMGKEKYQDAFTVDITNGVGTTVIDARFLAPAEVVVYRLEHVETEEIIP